MQKQSTTNAKFEKLTLEMDAQMKHREDAMNDLIAGVEDLEINTKILSESQGSNTHAHLMRGTPRSNMIPNGLTARDIPIMTPRAPTQRKNSLIFPYGEQNRELKRRSLKETNEMLAASQVSEG